jgi:hypothetical protein
MTALVRSVHIAWPPEEVYAFIGNHRSYGRRIERDLARLKALLEVPRSPAAVTPPSRPRESIASHPGLNLEGER